MSKRTGETIWKALECCASPAIKCTECPYHKETRCFGLIEEAFNLAKSLQKKINSYEQKLEDGELVSKEWHDEQVLHLQESNEQLVQANQALADEIVSQIEAKSELRCRVRRLETMLLEGKNGTV